MVRAVGDTVVLWLAHWTRIEWSGFEPWPGPLCRVLRQDTYSLTVPLSTQEYQ